MCTNMWNYFGIAFVVAVIGVGAFFLVHHTRSDQSVFPVRAIDVVSTSTVQTQTATSTHMAVPARTVPPGEKEYRIQRFHFSLLYPDTLQVQEHINDDGTLTVVFENADTTNPQGFQVFVQPYNLKEITPERFKKDEPSGVRLDAQPVTLDGATGVAFYSKDVSLGDTREVWFIHKGLLYEVDTPKALEAWFRDILGTWQFVE